MSLKFYVKNLKKIMWVSLQRNFNLITGIEEDIIKIYFKFIKIDNFRSTLLLVNCSFISIKIMRLIIQYYFDFNNIYKFVCGRFINNLSYNWYYRFRTIRFSNNISENLGWMRLLLCNIYYTQFLSIWTLALCKCQY